MKKRVLVTGASRGIGKAIAIRLAKEGYCVGINYLKGTEAAKATLAEIESQGGEGYLIPFDVSHRKKSSKAILKDVENNGMYWGIVLNAGVTHDAPFPLQDGEAWDKVVHTNLDSFHHVLHPIVMPMVRNKQGGRIITLSSISGLIGNRGQVNYSASKAGIIGATRSLAQEVARRNITVNCIAPGIIETDMTDELEKDQVIRMIPMRRFGQAEEVASLAAFLISDESAYITGQVISINGGMV